LHQMCRWHNCLRHTNAGTRIL